MKVLVIFCSGFLLFSQHCSKDNSVTYNDSDFKNYAHGYWEAVSGDISVSKGEALIIYNWYAIDTATSRDSVTVTWDDGRTCTKSMAIMTGNIIEFSEQGFDVIIKIEMKDGASASFDSATKSYQKNLKKSRNDPTVLCY